MNKNSAPTGVLRSIATRAAASLSRYDDVIAISLLGSIARGNAERESDIDLLILTEGWCRPSRLRRRLPPTLRCEQLTLLTYSRERWSMAAERGALFLHHIALEGETLYDRDGALRTGFDLLAERPPDVAGDIQRQIRRLRLYRDPKRLNGQHLFALSDLYSIGKAMAIARCFELGEPTFVKEEALRRLAMRRPELAEAADVVTRLRPFYDLTRGRAGSVLPFEAVGVEGEVEKAIEAVERLASA